jgi:hypothetical protein
MHIKNNYLVIKILFKFYYLAILTLMHSCACSAVESGESDHRDIRNTSRLNGHSNTDGPQKDIFSQEHDDLLTKLHELKKENDELKKENNNLKITCNKLIVKKRTSNKNTVIMKNDFYSVNEPNSKNTIKNPDFSNDSFTDLTNDTLDLTEENILTQISS